MDNKKCLRNLSIVQTVFGSLMIVLVIIGIISGGSLWDYILDILIAILILVAGGLGISATSPSRVVNSTHSLVTACMVLSIIAASVSLIVFVVGLLGLIAIGVYGPHPVLLTVLLVIILFCAAELVVSLWSAVCCGRLGACGCCLQQQAQMVGQAVYYVPNQDGTIPTVVVQGTPAGTNQAYPSTTSGMVFQPIQAQAHTSMYPPPYPGKEAGPTETKVPL